MRRLHTSLSLLFIIVISPVFGAQEEVTFKWTPVKPGTTVAMITVGKATNLPFEFQVQDPRIKKVMLSIDDEFVKMGIKLTHKERAVVGGKVVSSVEFLIKRGVTPGGYELKIRAKDTITGNVIGEGVIPFRVVPAPAVGC